MPAHDSGTAPGRPTRRVGRREPRQPGGGSPAVGPRADRRAAGPALRRLPPGRFIDHAALWRHRPGPGDQPPPRRADGRQPNRTLDARPRQRMLRGAPNVVLLRERLKLLPRRELTRWARSRREHIQRWMRLRSRLLDHLVGAGEQRMSRPIVFAVMRLTARSNLVGCSTGMSAGLAPRKILSTRSAERRKRSAKFTP